MSSGVRTQGVWTNLRCADTVVDPTGGPFITGDVSERGGREGEAIGKCQVLHYAWRVRVDVRR